MLISNSFELSEEELQQCDLVPGSFYSCNGLTNNAVLNALTKAKMSPEFTATHSKLAKEKKGFHSSTMTSGGFRISKSAVEFSKTKVAKYAFLVITSVENSKTNLWTDKFDSENNLLIYHGDNRHSEQILKTRLQGNQRLHEIFKPTFASSSQAFPILYFRLFSDNRVEFVGMAYPVNNGLKIVKEHNVPNYEAYFHIDQTSQITKHWLTYLKEGKSRKSIYAPKSWLNYVESNNDSSNVEQPLNQNTIYQNVQNEGEYEVKIRKTQNIFRNSLLKKQPKCLICGLENNDLLIASHIKPWADSTDREKIDLDNGLILCAMHDKLFDNGLISFDKLNYLCVSSLLSEKDKKILQLDTSQVFPELNIHQNYLEYHRKHIARFIAFSRE